MVEGRTPAIQIGQLNLRIPGIRAEVGQGIANGIGERLTEQVFAGLRGDYGALNVRVRVPPGASEGEMSAAIAQAILNAL